jgi:hypothetical protein
MPIGPMRCQDPVAVKMQVPVFKSRVCRLVNFELEHYCFGFHNESNPHVGLSKGP